MLARILFTAAMGLSLAGTAHASAGDGNAGMTPQAAALAVTYGAAAQGAPFDAGADVDAAFDMIRKGKQANAVALFDKVIADAGRHFAGETRPIRCRITGAPMPEAGAVMVDRSLCDAHFGKGFALIDMGQGDLAEAELLKATQLGPQSAHYANEYAELFKSRREWQKSYDLFERAWTIVDKNPAGPDARIAARALRGMGYNMVGLGNLAQARELFLKSQEYDPDSQAARIELSHIEKRIAIGM